MIKYINKIIAIAVLSIPLASFGQYCNHFHESFCTPSDNEMFHINGQSKSALFAKGQTSELNIIVYKGQDYRISLCMDENLGSQIQFKIYQTINAKVDKVVETKGMQDEYIKCDECNGTGMVDGNTCEKCNGEGQIATGKQVEVTNKETHQVVEKQKDVLYDNSADNYATEIEFSAETTKRLTIEVTVPDAGGSGSSKGIKTGKGKLMKSSDMGCVGILVEHMTTPISGFYGTGF